MALVSDSNRSDFPSDIDTFTTYANSQEERSVLDANIFNKILSAIYETEVYAQGIPRIIEAGKAGESRKVVLVKKYFTITTAKNSVMVELTVPTKVISIIGRNWHKVGDSILATAHNLVSDASNRGYRAWVEPVSATQLNVMVDHIDPSAYVEPGDYLVSVLFEGR